MRILVWLFIGFDRHETSEHLLTAVIEKLCRRGHSVHILQKNTGGDLPLIPDSLKEYNVTTTVVDFEKAVKTNLIKRYLKELNYIRRCAEYITDDYDAVFIQSNNVAGYAVRLIRKKNRKALITQNVQDIFPYNLAYCGKLKQNGPAFRFLAESQRYAYENADHVITISEDMKQTLMDDGVSVDKIEVIYNWSYQDGLYHTEKASQLFPENMVHIVYAGNLGMMQDVEVLIDAAALMKKEENLWFHIIGSGAYKEKLEKHAAEKKVKNISFSPPVPSSEVTSVYGGADVNVIPLAKNICKTALPSKTATILACGRPTVFAIGKDSIFGQNIQKNTECIVIDSSDPEALAEGIRTALKTDSHRRTDSYYKAYFSITKNSERYADIITEEQI